MSYTNIALCPQCGDITDDKCCDKDLILYESQNESFIESIIPLIKGIDNVQTNQRLFRARYVNIIKHTNVARYNILCKEYNCMVAWITFFIVIGVMIAFIKWGLEE